MIYVKIFIGLIGVLISIISFLGKAKFAQVILLSLCSIILIGLVTYEAIDEGSISFINWWVWSIGLLIGLVSLINSYRWRIRKRDEGRKQGKQTYL